MPFVAIGYTANPKAPVGKWVCTRTSALGPYDTPPPDDTRHNPDYCGQCVSYVTQVCPSLPVRTGLWRRGDRVKENKNIVAGTVIATFDSNGHYDGHAAIYDHQTDDGIYVYDQWITGTAPQAVSLRLILWQGRGVSNTGNKFFIVEH
ncbi:BPSL0067 family protein [Nitrospirillum sp. BR 11752]|uniref:BPSL0067 family protein n=1 Tax=Nitrospirillum sp. BR 11752 TaxID=3104293 RepID=UPI002E9DF7DD|nr:BPSL0067 family protein [Nitrospirillum sp. BR 11752]